MDLEHLHPIYLRSFLRARRCGARRWLLARPYVAMLRVMNSSNQLLYACFACIGPFSLIQVDPVLTRWPRCLSLIAGVG